MTEINRTLCETCGNKEYYPAQKPCLLCLADSPLRVTGDYYTKETNIDKVRYMNEEELALWFMDIQGDVARYYCGNYLQAPELPTTKEAWIKWLRSEVNAD